MKNVLQVLLMGTLAATVAFSAQSPNPKPNVLFIYTDDQRYDALSVVQQEQGARGRFPWFKTPHMDRLAAAPLPDLLGNDPNDAMQIGADLGSPVVEPVPPRFTGWIESVRIFRGEQKP